LVAGEDARWDWLLARRGFHQRINRLVESSWDVIKFKAIELVL
jgi:hypothetical protein